MAELLVDNGADLNYKLPISKRTVSEHSTHQSNQPLAIYLKNREIEQKNEKQHEEFVKKAISTNSSSAHQDDLFSIQNKFGLLIKTYQENSGFWDFHSETCNSFLNDFIGKVESVDQLKTGYMQFYQTFDKDYVEPKDAKKYLKKRKNPNIENSEKVFSSKFFKAVVDGAEILELNLPKITDYKGNTYQSPEKN